MTSRCLAGKGRSDWGMRREKRRAYLICELMPKRATSSGQKSLDAMPADKSFCIPVCLLLRNEAMVAKSVVEQSGPIRSPIRLKSFPRVRRGVGRKLVMVGFEMVSPRGHLPAAAGTSGAVVSF